MELTYQFATIRELGLYHKWANDPTVRKFSYNSNEIPLEQHSEWFKNKLLNTNCYLYYFHSQLLPVGQVRIEVGENETVIGISVDEEYRGKGLSSKLLIEATADFFLRRPNQIITAYIKQENEASVKSFLKAGFGNRETVTINGTLSYRLKKSC